MNQKDLSEKLLFDFNDVFADIVNGFIFKGAQKIKPNQLRNSKLSTQFKADDNKLHEQHRDVLKEWSKSNIRIALFGMENQTKPDKNMPFRVLNYDGISYKSQLIESKSRKIPNPVITLVLYFGIEKRWDYSTNIKSLLKYPKALDSFISDYKINVFEVAWMDESELDNFSSDFRVVANLLIKKRKNPNYIPDDKTVIKHFDEMMKFFSVVLPDKNFEAILEIPKEERKEVDNMDSAWQSFWDKSRDEGKNEGECTMLYRLVSKGIVSFSDGASELGISVRKLKSDMKKMGFNVPTNK